MMFAQQNFEKQPLSGPDLSNKVSPSQSVCNVNQNVIHIYGIPILFPFQPYECQMKYMTKVIEALNQVQYAFGVSILIEPH